MSAITPELLAAVAREFAQLSVDPGDLPALVAQFAPQVPALARLDELGLREVEPAVVLPAPEARP
ncbi:MAG: hypothetical protein ACE147_13465 [Candidatus Methylomirabilales bacterium]